MSDIRKSITASARTRDPPRSPDRIPEDPEEMFLHIQMYALGDKLLINHLKSHAKLHFFRVASHHWQGPDFLVAMRMVYDSTPESDTGLRDVVVELYLTHTLALMETPDFITLAHDLSAPDTCSRSEGICRDCLSGGFLMDVARVEGQIWPKLRKRLGMGDEKVSVDGKVKTGTKRSRIKQKLLDFLQGE